MSADTNPPSGLGDLVTQERRLRRDLGFWGLVGTAFGGIIGSGWMFSPYFGARIAGPAVLVSWLVAGLAVTLVGLVVVELGVSRAEAGGGVRWPLYASGRLVGTVVGWSVLMAVTSATQVLAITTYAAHYLPWLYDGETLSARGVAVAAGLEAVLVVLNWHGVVLFARLNLAVTWTKFVVPAVTAAVLIASGFGAGRGHLTDPATGGFAPYGWGAVLTAVSTGGIVFSVNGAQTAVEFSGEARDPKRDIPRAVFTAIALALTLYLLLQLAFLAAVPADALAGGWHGIDLTSPFSQLALSLQLAWLSSVLYAEAVISPCGSELIGVAVKGRRTYALAKNRLLPRAFTRVDPGSGIPRRALALNYALGLAILVPLRSWQLVSVLGVLYMVDYAVAAVAAGVFRAVAPGPSGGRWRAPAAFVVCTLIVYWSTWRNLRVALPLALLGVAVFLVLRERDRPLRSDVAAGGWVVVHLGALLGLSAVGGFGGAGWISGPYDSMVVAVAVYRWGVQAGVGHVRRTRGLDVPDSPAVSDALTNGGRTDRDSGT